MPRYIDITKCAHAAVTVTTVKSISFSQSIQRLTSAGDGDKRTTFQAKGMEDVSGSITLEDPIQAAALLAAASGALVFECSEGNDLTKVSRHTIAGVSFFSLGDNAAHNAIEGVTLGFNSFAATGALVTTVAATIP